MAPGSAASKIDAFINEKYIPLDRNIKVVIFIVLLILPLLLFYFFFYTAQNDKIKTLIDQKTTLIAEISKAKKAASELDKIKREMARTQELFRETATLLPKKKEIPNLLRSISDLGKGAGLDFVSFVPGGESPKDFYAEIPVNIVIKGPYHNLGFFLDQVSKLERIVSVNNITMGSPQKSGGEMILNSSCRLVTYRFTNVQQKPRTKKR